MSLRGAFWRFAHKRYQIRKPFPIVGPALVLFGTFWLIVFAFAAAISFERLFDDLPDSLGYLISVVLFAFIPITIGVLHWRIRREWEKGSNALYRKRLKTNPLR